MPTISQVLTALISALLGRRFAVLAWLGIVAWRKKSYGKTHGEIWNMEHIQVFFGKDMENIWE